MRRLPSLNDLFDRAAEAAVRSAATRIGRRRFLARLGGFIVGAGVIPVLPYAKAVAADDDERERDCDYWRYCAIDGNLCACCGGSATRCPPGSVLSAVNWVGTCRNDEDGRTYLVSYSDCCGKAPCGRCRCVHNLRERPPYRMGVNNDVNWCMSNDSIGYHCTIAVVVGLAE